MHLGLCNPNKNHNSDMKKILVISLLLIAGISLKAQEQFKYDTLIYYPQEVAGCPTWIDSFPRISPGMYPSGIIQPDYTLLTMLMASQIVCCQPQYPYWRPVIGANEYATGFAQPFHFDSTMIVCGVAARVFGDCPTNPLHWCYFQLRDTNTTTAFATLAFAQVPGFNPDIEELDSTTHLQPIPRHYFNIPVSVKDFYIVVDSLLASEYSNEWGNDPYCFDHSCTFDYDSCDTIMDLTYVPYYASPYGYHIGCDVAECPKFYKDGRWISFSDDTIYYHYARKFIAWYPIVLIPQLGSGGLSKIDVSSICNIFPNPASTYLKLVSELKVKRIEIYNIAGAKVKEEPVNEFQKAIDISYLPAGSYVINIYTTQGSAQKKFVKE